VQKCPSSVSLTVERVGAADSGLLRIYGSGPYSIFWEADTEDMDYYGDIHWPIGASTAAYMFSVKDDEGIFRIHEIGEAYITY